MAIRLSVGKLYATKLGVENTLKEDGEKKSKATENVITQL